MNLLDRPIWSSLSSHHANFALGSGTALRYNPQINVFAATLNDSAADWQALAALLALDDEVLLLQVPEIDPADILSVSNREVGVQMVLEGQLPAIVDSVESEIGVLGPADHTEMLALATRTQPGPFVSRTPEMGRFLGIRRDGQLAAMAGERMKFPGFTEISGVCCAPEFRGQGLARALSIAVAANILERDERPILHAWIRNHRAIRLYEKIGFVIRCNVNVAQLSRLH